MRANTDVLQAGHALGVGAHQDPCAVLCPGGDLDWRDAGVEPPREPGVVRVVGTLEQRRGGLGRGETRVISGFARC